MKVQPSSPGPPAHTDAGCNKDSRASMAVVLNFSPPASTGRGMLRNRWALAGMFPIFEQAYALKEIACYLGMAIHFL